MAHDNIQLVGRAIRRIRKQKKLSLQDLASRAGVAVGVLSQIERNLGNPSLKTLTRIHRALEIPLSALFENGSTPTNTVQRTAQELERYVKREGTRVRLQFGSPLLMKEMLSPSKNSHLQFMVLSLLPGGSSGDAPLSYPAEKGGLVLEGTFELDLDGQKLILREGDSFQFDGTIPHIFSNPYTTPANLIWIIAYEPMAPSL